MTPVLLDTNAFTALFRGDEDALRTVSCSDHVYASVIAIGELEAGFRGGSQYQRNIAVLERFLTKPTVETLLLSRETSDYFGRIKDQLRTNGTPIPLNDVWLAAQCLENGALLVSYDHHFAKVPGIRFWNK